MRSAAERPYERTREPVLAARRETLWPSIHGVAAVGKLHRGRDDRAAEHVVLMCRLREPWVDPSLRDELRRDDRSVRGARSRCPRGWQHERRAVRQSVIPRYRARISAPDGREETIAMNGWGSDDAAMGVSPDRLDPLDELEHKRAIRRRRVSLRACTVHNMMTLRRGWWSGRSNE